MLSELPVRGNISPPINFQVFSFFTQPRQRKLQHFERLKLIASCLHGLTVQGTNHFRKLRIYVRGVSADRNRLTDNTTISLSSNNVVTAEGIDQSR